MQPHIAISCTMEDGAPTGQGRIPEAWERIEEWAEVTYLDATAEHPDADWSAYDLYRMEKRKEPAVNDLQRAARYGIPTVNPVAGTMTVINRPARYDALKDRVPMPRTEFGPVSEADIDPPVILKQEQQMGDGGLTQEIVFDETALDREEERVVQAYMDVDTEYKAYQFGEACRVSELTGPAADDRREVHRGDGYAAVQDIADRVQDETGLNIFGLDVIAAGDRYFLIDVNDEASYRGVSNAPELYDRAVRMRAREAVPEVDTPRTYTAPTTTATLD